MMNEQKMIDQHVGELLSGFVDGELTQQERQRVSLHCQQCASCQGNLDSLKELRERIGKSKLSELGEDKWREHMDDTAVQTTRSIGWILFIAGWVIIGGIGLFTFLFSSEISMGMKLLLVAIYGGLGLLFFSVLRQRVIEHKTDKYKDVEI